MLHLIQERNTLKKAKEMVDKYKNLITTKRRYEREIRFNVPINRENQEKEEKIEPIRKLKILGTSQNQNP